MTLIRNFLRAFITLAAAGAIIVSAWYGVENYRGARLWADTRRELEARGESFEKGHFIPAPVPDAQNFALAPFFVQLYQYRVDPGTGLLTFNQEGSMNAVRTTDTIPFGDGNAVVSSGPGWAAGHSLDLERFRRYYRGRTDFPQAPAPQSAAADVLLALTRFGPMFDEIEHAFTERPQARFPVNWTQKPVAAICLPHYNLIQKLVAVLRLRACADLALQRNDAALHDIELGLRLRGTIAAEPTLICNLVDVTCCGLLAQPIWEGLAGHRWTAARVQELQAALGEVDLLTNYQRTLRSNRAFIIIPLADDLRQARDLNDVFNPIEAANSDSKFVWPRWMSALNRLFPHGWYDEAKAVACRLDQQYVLDPVDVSRRRLDARRIEEGNAFIHRLPVIPSTILAKVWLPVSCSTTVRIARAQTIVDQAMTACALERFYLDHQSYPSALNALVPAYLKAIPNDVIDGGVMRYQTTTEGGYRLWAVGWNGQDENGKPPQQNEGLKVDEKTGDWTWQIPGAEPSANAPLALFRCAGFTWSPRG